MRITINIYNKGQAIGTMGWLLAQFQAENLTIGEYNAKNGHHGLWLKSKDGSLSQCLAMWDYYSIGNDIAQEQKYQTMRNINHERDSIWTDAAWEILMTVAYQWCCWLNEQESQEQGNRAPSLKIIRETLPK